MDAVGLKPMIEILKKIGLPPLGFPFKYSRRIDYSTILANVKKYLNLDYLFLMSVEPDPKNSTVNKIYLSKPRNNNIFPA